MLHRTETGIDVKQNGFKCLYKNVLLESWLINEISQMNKKSKIESKYIDWYLYEVGRQI